MTNAERRSPPVKSGRIGVIDIGSNSIRLVVYDSPTRAPVPIFNEKVMCALGRGMGETGSLRPEGVALALDNLARFAAVTAAMGVRTVEVIATAAVRDAEDGADFVAAAAKRSGLSIRVLSGVEEARLSAQGVLSDIPEADGLMGDLGGGSLELVTLAQGKIGPQSTLPLGPLRLLDSSGGELKKAAAEIDAALDDVPWLADVKGKRFYAVGGSWRALARIHMAQVDYPLRVIHRYDVKRARMENVVELVSKMSRRSLERLSGLPRRRLDTLPIAALLFERILRRAAPKRVVFSANGLREGVVFDRLPAEVRREDPLLSACAQMAERHARFPRAGESLVRWTASLFPDEAPADTRRRRAACALSDIAATDHPDYRAEQALLRIVRSLVLPSDHAGRAFLALVVYFRYGGDGRSPVFDRVRSLLDEEEAARARRLGVALRLGYTLSGGSPEVLADVPLGADRDRVWLDVPAHRAALLGEDVTKRLNQLAGVLDRKPAIVVGGARRGAGA